MEIGQKLKNARVDAGMTQENVAEAIHVSRQTISNWETGKTFPDIISVVELSNLYSLSLDDLLKGDKALMDHLEENTNTVKSSKKLITAILLNMAVVSVLFVVSAFSNESVGLLVGVFCVTAITTGILLYQIVRRI